MPPRTSQKVPSRISNEDFSGADGLVEASTVSKAGSSGGTGGGTCFGLKGGGIIGGGATVALAANGIGSAAGSPAVEVANNSGTTGSLRGGGIGVAGAGCSAGRISGWKSGTVGAFCVGVGGGCVAVASSPRCDGVADAEREAFSLSV